MKFDSIVMGGGLSGLACGIALQQAGQRVALVSAGQSTLHFHSGSFDLLGYDATGTVVENPLEAMQRLDSRHPYSKLDACGVPSLLNEARQLLANAGIATHGDAGCNHYRLTPIGAFKPTWLSINDFATFKSPLSMPWKRVLVANVIGFLDFPTQFIVEALRARGVMVDVTGFSTPRLSRARKSLSEMRSTNVAKVLSLFDEIDIMASSLNEVAQGYEALLLPSILGEDSDEAIAQLKNQLEVPLQLVPTLPPLVAGVRTELLLKRRFQALGGLYIVSDTVVGGTFQGNRLQAVTTAKLHGEQLEARDFVLATGAFMSHGLESNYNGVYEPIFNLDVEALPHRTEWTRDNVMQAQPYMEFGVATQADFKAMKEGTVVDNLYAVGSILSGHNSVKLADGAGVDLLTALQVAHTIAK